MKTFKQFLLEEDQDIFELIKKDCQPFLEAANGKFLIRGAKSIDGSKIYKDKNIQFSYSKRQVRKDRNPRETSKKDQAIQDEWFKDKFGVKARSESLFCLSEYKKYLAYGYGKGNVCSIFPIGEFKIIWSPKIKDLFGELSEYSNITANEIRSKLESANYIDTDIDSALESNCELMLICDEYYSLPYFVPGKVQSEISNTEMIYNYIKEKLS